MNHRSRRKASNRHVRRAGFFSPLSEMLENRTLLTLPANLNLVASPNPINEGGTETLTGSFTDTDPNNEVHTLFINWGNGDNSSVTIPAGGRTFSTSHVYSNLLPDGNPSSTYSISAQLNDSTGHSTTNVNTPTVTVNNVAPTVAITGAPATNPNEGGTINLGSSVTDPGGAGDSFTYQWRVNSNPAGTSPSLSFTPQDNGQYTVQLRVTDQNNGVTTATQIINVNDVAPSPTITGAPATSPEGTTISLTGSATDPSSVDTAAGLTYGWRVVKDGGVPLFASGPGNTFSFTPDDNGTYTVYFDATDKDGVTGTTSQVITVTDVAPTPAMHGDSNSLVPVPTTGTEGSPITLNGTATDVSTVDTAAGFAFTWHVVSSNGQVIPDATGPNFSFTPVDNGIYTVSLTATDKDGLSNTTSASITVSNVAPTVSLGGATSGSEGSPITLTGVATDPGALDTFSYVWHVASSNGQSIADASGTAANGASIPNFSFTPNDNGTYTISLTVTDDDGGAGAATRVINVTDVAPVPTVHGATTASPAPTTGTAGTPITLTGTATDISPVDTLAGFTFSWSIAPPTGSPITGTGSSITFTPSLTGVYQVTLFATDKDGVTGSTTVPINVGVVAPTVQIFGPTDANGGNLNEGATVNLVAQASSSASNATFAYAWHFTGVPSGAPAVPDSTAVGDSFVAAEGGTYTGTLTVTDTTNGGVVVQPFTITVHDVAPTPTIHSGASTTTSAPTSGTEGTAITMNATATSPSSVDQALGFTYTWKVTSNNSQPTINGTGSSFSFTPTDNGTYVVQLSAIDADGGSPTGTTTTTINVANRNPTATITSGPTSTGTEGVSMTFGGNVAEFTNSVDLAQGLNYVWSVAASNGQVVADVTGTTTTGTVSGFTFTPTDEGTYTVNLTVSDKDGGSGSTSRVITVGELALSPTITFSPTSNYNEGSPITVTGHTGDSTSNDVYSYGWTVYRNPGPSQTVYSTGSGVSYTFTPNDNGPYAVKLVVTETDDASSWTVTQNFTVNNVAPTPVIHGATTVTPAPTSVSQGTTINLTSTVTDPSTVDSAGTITYLWHVIAPPNNLPNPIPDGTGTTFSFTPQAVGTYTVVLSATDKDGGTGTTTDVIQVLNVSPSVAITNAPTTTPEGTLLTLGSSVTDPGISSGVENPTYLWHVTNNTGQTVADGTGASFSFAPWDGFGGAQPATYTVVLTVNDGSGGSSSDTKTFTVTNVAPSPTISGAPASSPEATTIFLTGNPNDPGFDPGEDPLSSQVWTVTSTNGQVIPSGTGNAFIFTPNDNGTYTVTYKVTDKEGAIGQVVKTITVTDVAPVPTITFTSPASPPPGGYREGVPITLTGSATDVSSVDSAATPPNPFAFSWTVIKNPGPGQTTFATGTGKTFTFTPDDNATYQIILGATDKDSVTGTTSTTITTQNVAPGSANSPGGAAIFSSGGPVNEGSVGVVFFANVTDAAADLPSLTYSYDFNNDGNFTSPGDIQNSPNPAVGIPASLTQDGPGTFTVHGQIKDKDGATSDFTTTVTVVNVAPTPTIHGATTTTAAPTTGTVGTAIALTATATDPSPQDTSAGFTYAWKVTEGPGPNPPVVFTGSGASFSFTPATEDSYTVTLTATDKNGGAQSTTQTINVGAVFPTAVFSNGGPINEGSPGTVFFSGQSGGGPVAGGPYTYSYDFNNNGNFSDPGEIVGTTNSAVQVPASFTGEEGTLTVRGRITDANNHFTDYTTTITINAVPPTPTIHSGPTSTTTSAPTTGTEGTAITMNATATSPSPLDTSFAFSWTVIKNPGPGQTTFATGSGNQFTFTPNDNGIYAVTVAATDDAPNPVAGTATTNITVGNVAPTVSIGGPTNGQEGAALNFTSTATDPSSVDTSTGLAYTWHVITPTTTQPPAAQPPDGHGTTFGFTPTQNGIYTVTLTVVDKDGGSTVATQLVNVANVAPTLSLSGNASGTVNVPYTLTLNSSDPGNDPVSSWTINWGDGSPLQTVTVPAPVPANVVPVVQTVTATHSYVLDGNYTISATATDPDNTFAAGNTVAVQIIPSAAAGPRVIGINPSGNVSDPFGSLRVTFDKPILASSFVPSAVSLVGPNGSVTPIAISQVSAAVFDITFPVQTDLGAYNLTINPVITDTSGNLMNQDGDATNGENPDDRYTTTINRVAATVGNYDFGTPTSPVTAGFTQVTAATTYSPAQGYGWTSGTIFNADRGVGTDLTRDLNYTTDGTFVVDVVNGSYQVTVTLGDMAAAHDNVGVYLEGTQVDTVTTAAAHPVVKTYSVIVSDGQLTLRLTDLGGTDPYTAIEGLTIGPDLAGPRVIASSPSGTVYGGSVDHVRLTFDKPIFSSSFSLADVVSLSGPGGPIAPTGIVPVTPGTFSTQFDVTFAPQTALGSYSLTVGPNILDQYGNQMNQDADANNGEVPSDQYTATFSIAVMPSFFDFGTAGSPVASGYTQVTATTGYSPGLGYGWTLGAISDVDRGTADPLTRDMNYMHDGTFVVDEPNGVYQVTVTLGDSGGAAHDQMGVYFQGVQVDSVSTAAGQTITKTYTVTVSSGQLVMRLNDLGGTDPNVAIEAMTIGLDKTGPSVVSSTPTGTKTGQVDNFILTFSEPILASSLTLGQLSLTGPGGPIGLPPATSSITQINATTFQVSFAPQTALGTYSLKVGTGVTDLAGNPMNQNGNNVNGEAGDTYTASVTLQATTQTFDFGTAGSPLAAGDTRVTSTTSYSAAQGYGWAAGLIAEADRGVGTDATRDMNYTTDGTFWVDLANGTYTITITLGDTGGAYHDNMGVFLQGTQVDSVSTNAGQVVTKTYTVTVSGGRLVLRLADLGGTDPYTAIEELKIS